MATGWSARWSVYQLERMHNFSVSELDRYYHVVEWSVVCSFHHALAEPEQLYYSLITISACFCMTEIRSRSSVPISLVVLSRYRSDWKTWRQYRSTGEWASRALHRYDHDYSLKIKLDHCNTGSAGLFVFIFDARNQINRTQIFANLLFEGSGAFAV